MNNKIIGFAISKSKINCDDIDIFNSGLSIKSFINLGYNIYLWGIGNLNKCYLDKNTISLSFPLYKKLDDRNVLIKFNDNSIIIENDWLGSIHIYYNKKLKIISTLYKKTYDVNNMTLNISGLYNYLDFGYVSFEKTPVDNVQLMRYFSKLIINEDIRRVFKDDIYMKKISINKRKSTSDLVVKTINKYIKIPEKKIKGNIIIPTSGGFDSRFLNSLISNKERIRAFTYGIINDKYKPSSEIVNAKYVTEKLNIWWKNIYLSKYLVYYLKWYQLYGISTHLHGMYHIEFYQKIRKMLHKKNNMSVLSGIYGDAWSGNINPINILSLSDVWKIGYSHDLRINPSILKTKPKIQDYKKFYSDFKKHLLHRNKNLLIFIRIKFSLLSYLMTIPDYFGMPSWSPFLSFNNVSKILALPNNLFENREWQKNYFRMFGIYPEDKNLSVSNDNTLDFDAVCSHPLPNINIFRLSRYIKLGYLLRTFLGYEMLKLFKNRRYFKYFNDISILKSLDLLLLENEKTKKY